MLVLVCVVEASEQMDTVSIAYVSARSSDLSIFSTASRGRRRYFLSKGDTLAAYECSTSVCLFIPSDSRTRDKVLHRLPCLSFATKIDSNLDGIFIWQVLTVVQSVRL